MNSVRSNMFNLSCLNEVVLHDNMLLNEKKKIIPSATRVNVAVTDSIKNLSFIILQKFCFAVVH